MLFNGHSIKREFALADGTRRPPRQRRIDFLIILAAAIMYASLHSLDTSYRDGVSRGVLFVLKF